MVGNLSVGPETLLRKFYLWWITYNRDLSYPRTMQRKGWHRRAGEVKGAFNASRLLHWFY